MTRKEVKEYIQLNFRVCGEEWFNSDNAVHNIIDAITDSWFFSWNIFVFGMIIGAIIVLIFK